VLCRAVLANAIGLRGPLAQWLVNASLLAMLGAAALIWLAYLWMANRDRRHGRSDDEPDTDKTESRQL
jgi:threonine/homoserine/homoserine lactone efflux protein